MRDFFIFYPKNYFYWSCFERNSNGQRSRIKNEKINALCESLKKKEHLVNPTSTMTIKCRKVENFNKIIENMLFSVIQCNNNNNFGLNL